MAKRVSGKGGGRGGSLVKECRPSDGKGVEGVSFWGVDDFPYSTVHILGGGLDMGQDSCVQSPGNPDPCQV